MRRLLLCLILTAVCRLHGMVDFELIPRGGRALAMGGTGSSISNNAYATFYNPALLCRVEKIELSLEYTPLWGLGDHLTSAGAVFPFAKEASMAVAFSRAEITDIPMYNELTGVSFEERITNLSLRSTGIPSGTLSNSSDLLILSVSRWFNFNASTGEFSRLSIPLTVSGGVSVKFNRQLFSVESGEAAPDYVGISTDVDGGVLAFFDLDRDIRRNTAIKRFSASLVLKNIFASSMQYNTDTRYMDEGERIRIVGISYEHLLDKFKTAATATVDFIKTKDKNLERIGGELLYDNKLAVRLGLIDESISFGCGFRYHNFSIDWAYRRHDLASQPYKITISYQIGHN